MSTTGPATAIDQRFSSPEATARSWADARAQLTRAGIYWLSTIRPEGRPHVTPLIGVCLGDALYFCTGPDERKAKNLAANPACVLTTGCNALGEGFDVVVEGTAEQVRDEALLHRRFLRPSTEATGRSPWGTVFEHEGGTALVFEVAPTTAFGFGKGEPFSQTRYRF